VALRVNETDEEGIFEVMGRGELHLTILLENMRREGYELAVSKPRVVFKDINGEKHEPIELVTADIEEQPPGRRDASAGRAQGRTGEHGAGWPWPCSPGIPHSGAWPDRFYQRVLELDPWLRA